MKYVIPFTDDLSEYQEALVSETVEKLASGQYTSKQEALSVIEGLYTVIEGLREHSARLEEELKEVYRNEFQQL